MTNKYGYILFASLGLLAVPSAALARPSSLTETTQEKIITVEPKNLLVRVENQLNPKIIINNQEDPTDCSGFVGDELKTKMRWLETTDLKKNLINFGPQKRILYARSLHNHEVLELSERLGKDGRKELTEKINDGSVREFFEVIDNRIESMDLSFGEKSFMACFVLVAFIAVTVGTVKPDKALETIGNSRNAMLMHRHQKKEEQA